METTNETFTFFFKKPNESVTIDWAGLSEKAKEYAIAYGLRQLLADSFAGAESQGEASALLFKRLEAFKAGTIGQRASGGGKSELEKMVFAQLKALLKAKVKGLSGEALEQATKDTLAKLNPDQMAKLESQAKAKIAERERQKAAERAALAEFGDIEL